MHGGASRFPVLTVAVLCLYLLAALVAEAVRQSARLRDETPEYNRPRLELRYLPPLTRATDAEGVGHFFWLGSDNLGRSVAQRLLQGARIALHVGLVSSLLAVPFGTLLGLFAGWRGGATDALATWLATTVAAIPAPLLVLAVSLVAGKGLFHAVYRQGDLWWHDLLYTVKQVERNGSRAVMWSDKICDGRDAFLARMPKDVLLSPWYYGKDFSDKHLLWDKSFEKKSGTWDVQRNLAASFVALNDAGYDLLPCTSNWSCDDAAEALVSFCITRLDQKRLKGIYTAPWRMTIPDEPNKKHISKTLEGIDLFAAAMNKHYPLPN